MNSSDYSEINNTLNNYYGNKMKLYEECYMEHNKSRELSAPKQDSDQWYTLYESEVRGW